MHFCRETWIFWGIKKDSALFQAKEIYETWLMRSFALIEYIPDHKSWLRFTNLTSYDLLAHSWISFWQRHVMIYLLSHYSNTWLKIMIMKNWLEQVLTLHLSFPRKADFLWWVCMHYNYLQMAILKNVTNLYLLLELSSLILQTFRSSFLVCSLSLIHTFTRTLFLVHTILPTHIHVHALVNKPVHILFIVFQAWFSSWFHKGNSRLITN